MSRRAPLLSRVFGRSRRDQVVIADATGEIVAGIAYVHPSKLVWWLGFLLSGGLLGILAVCLSFLFERGIVVWGNNRTTVWALDITSYDWWMGLACGALLLSSVFLHRGHRGSLSRIADTAALLSAVAAAIYPIIHLGRPWFFYWNMAYPNVMGLWPQFRSPLFWDETDIVGFLVIALLFWFVGLIPDFAVLRDRAPLLRQKQLYGIAALGWRGDVAHWLRWRASYRVLAVLAALIAINVQWGASMMYAISLEPGWHDTLLPVQYVTDAALGGAGLIAVLTSLVRAMYPLGEVIREEELDALGRALLTLGIIAAYCYGAEFFFTAFGGDSYERAAMARRVAGPVAWAFWVMVGCALLPVHLLWFRAARRSAGMLLLVGLLVMAGMWANNFMDLVGTLSHDFLPSSAHRFSATIWGVGTWLGSIGLFLAPFMLFLRYLPVVSINEARPSRSALEPVLEPARPLPAPEASAEASPEAEQVHG
jgi:formate-dependent nitrite reductase membrane component NrfD